MSRLFVKIFLAFWLTMVVIVGAMAWVNFVIWQQEGDSRGTSLFRERAERMVERTVMRIERVGPGQVRGGPGRGMVFVFDADGEGVGNRRPLPPHLSDLALPRRGAENDEGPGFVARAAVAPTGERYRVVSLVPTPPLLLAGGRQGVQLRLLVAVLISALLCWLLAWLMLRPVHRLRWATSQLAAGDLSQRVNQRGHFARDEIGMLAGDFDRMAASLESAQQNQLRLLRDISHELRSPLARMQVALELARDSEADHLPRHLDRIDEESGRLNALIGDILELSRTQTDGLALALDAIDLGAMLGEISDRARFEGQGRQVDVVVTAPAALSMTGDARLIERAIENIVRNAVAHEPDGGRVDVTAVAAGEGVRIEVADHGPGVPSEQLERIFDPFHRVDEARSPGGHGVGLALTRAAVEVHGGRVSASTRKDGGLTVQLDLPRDPRETSGPDQEA
ncbi:MAG: HAMP domain-containing sensor histidine kinase [Pseudomonadota bacterium]